MRQRNQYRGYGGCGWPLLPADLETIGLARDQRPATSQPATTQSSTSQTQTNDAPFQACTVLVTAINVIDLLVIAYHDEEY